jgi:hypothetical protein
MRSPAGARTGLAILCLVAVSVGLPAAVDPHFFYADFPFFTHWVDLLPPYNEHLVTDVGGLYLLTAAIHLAFHATHLDTFGAADAVGEVISLAVLLVPPAVAIWAVAEPATNRV